MEKTLFDTPDVSWIRRTGYGRRQRARKSEILCFSHVLEKHDQGFEIQTILNAMRIAALCLCKNNSGTRDPETH